ncbi:cytochrome P450 [Oscillatoria sp. HE19RPO]|uniref:cytochrome P450 n=1 Tax=Oscillatoria sp. HE19RPO TaxID=2954806 RepID=UPI0020C1E8BF|nr:cytochrome P450 [Oscillatoria sp. HE19RPO]
MVPLPFDPRSPEFRANPYPTYRYLQTHHPIYYRAERKDWLLTRYADIVEVLQNPSFGRSPEEQANRQSAKQAPANRFLELRQESQKLMKLWLLLRNPPAHTRIRHLLHHAFTQSRIQALRSRLQTQVDRLIDRVKNRRKMDIIQDFAYPLTLQSNCEVLGIPESEWHPHFQQRSQDLSLTLDLDATAIANERGLLAIAAFADYFRSLVANWHSYSLPHNTAIGTLIQAQAEGKLSERELIANCILLFHAGQSTTKDLIANAILVLLRHPEQLHLLQTDPSLIEMTISEVLRYQSPLQSMSRTALSDIQLSNQTIDCGQILHCIIAAGNRDPAKFPDPDRFDIKRKPNPYLSFGHGIHTCIGMHLAKLVAEIAVGTLVRRLPELSLATDCLEWEETFLVIGLKSLPVVF